MLLEKPMYAYEISKTLNERFGFSTAIVTVYVVLYKLQREGFIRIKEERAVPNRPDRKYYEVTDNGKEIFIRGRNFLEVMVKKLFIEKT